MLKLAFALIAVAQAAVYVGTDIADITGATTQVGMMGYGKESQTATGLFFRQFARAHVILDRDAGTYVAVASLDIAMTFATLKDDIITRANRLLAEHQHALGPLSHTNTLLSSTHTHGGPGGFSKYTLYSILTLGYNNQTAEAIVAGTAKALAGAYMKAVYALRDNNTALISLASAPLHNSSANRSPTSYDEDPEHERAQYDGNVDSTFTLLRVDVKDKSSSTAVTAGATRLSTLLTFFAVHCTSMFNDNTLVTGDNKGLASMELEAALAPANITRGSGDFVASFYSANLGDSSPNIAGAFCPDGVTPCDALRSTCDGRNAGCQGRGPHGLDDAANTAYIAFMQISQAVALLNVSQLPSSASLPPALAARFPPTRLHARGPHAPIVKRLGGGLASRMIWVEMSNSTVPEAFTATGTKGQLCPAALGHAFAAGTTDGPGQFDFEQGTTSLNPFWTIVRNILIKPSEHQIACQLPKPVLIDLGEAGDQPGIGGILGKFWSAHRLPFQIVRLSADPPVLLCAVPGEATTMAGRRIRLAVAAAYARAHNARVAALATSGPARRSGAAPPVPRTSIAPDDVTVVLTGLSNEYAHYVATYEEYQAQRYEGASTLYGPHTHAMHMYAFSSLAAAIARDDYVYPAGLDAVVPPEWPPTPPAFLPPVIVDIPTIGYKFGDLYVQPNRTYCREQNATAVFAGANLRNNLRPHPQFGYMVAEQNVNGVWVPVADDSHFNTRVEWVEYIASSHITLTWTIPADVALGTYRMRHFGYAKHIMGDMSYYEGSTNPFNIIDCDGVKHVA